MRRRVARRRARGVRSGVGSAGYAVMWAGLHVQVQSAQGMGAQKRGAALPLGSGKARGVGVRRRGAARGVAAQHTRCRFFITRCRVREEDVKAACLIVAFIKVTKVTLHHVLKAETTRPLLLKSPGSYYLWFIIPSFF